MTGHRTELSDGVVVESVRITHRNRDDARGNPKLTADGDTPTGTVKITEGTAGRGVSVEIRAERESGAVSSVSVRAVLSDGHARRLVADETPAHAVPPRKVTAIAFSRATPELGDSPTADTAEEWSGGNVMLVREKDGYRLLITSPREDNDRASAAAQLSTGVAGRLTRAVQAAADVSVADVAEEQDRQPPAEIVAERGDSE